MNWLNTVNPLNHSLEIFLKIYDYLSSPEQCEPCETFQYSKSFRFWKGLITSVLWTWWTMWTIWTISKIKGFQALKKEFWICNWALWTLWTMWTIWTIFIFKDLQVFQDIFELVLWTGWTLWTLWTLRTILLKIFENIWVSS